MTVASRKEPGPIGGAPYLDWAQSGSGPTMQLSILCSTKRSEQ